MAQGYVYGGSPASLAARTSSIGKPTLPPGSTKTQYYTTIGQAKQALGQLPSDEPGFGVRFAKGLGYYLGAAAAAPGKKAAGGAAGGSSTAPGLSDSQLASNAIQQILAPIITQITQAAATRAQQGTQAIQGFTNDATAKLQGIDFGAPYQQAATDQNAVNTALLAQLKGSGSSLQNQLAGELGTSVPNMAGAVSGQVGSAVNGAAGANLAKGDATLSQLLSQGAGARDYGAKLPGLETLAGLQDVSKLQGTTNANMQSQLSDVQSKVPQMVQDYLGQLATNRNAQAKLTQDAQIAQQKNEVASLIAAGKVKQAIQVANMANSTRASIANANNATRQSIASQANQTKLQIANAADIAKARNSDRSYSIQFAKTFGYDPVTGKLAAGYGLDQKGHVIKLSTAKTSQPRLTAKEIQDYRGTATTIAQNAHEGFQTADKNGAVTNHPAISYQQAIVEMDKEGVPRPIAIAALNQFYPGPVHVGPSTPAQRAKAKAAGQLGIQVVAPGERG